MAAPNRCIRTQQWSSAENLSTPRSIELVRSAQLLRVMKQICLVTPDLYGSHGGIARITRSTCGVLRDFAESRGAQLVVHALHDAPREADFDGDHVYAGYGGSRTRFAASVLKTLKTCDVVATVYAHVNLSTLHLGSRVPYFVAAHGIEVWSALSKARLHALRNAQRV